MNSGTPSAVQRIRALRKLVSNHDAYLHCHFSQHAEETEICFRNGDRLLLRPRGGQRVADSDIFEEVILDNAYCLEESDIGEMCVLDIGAHTGMFAISALRLGASRVIAVEPDALNFETLARNADLNKHYRLEKHCAAVAPRSGRLLRSPTNSGAHRFIPGDKTSPEGQEPEMILRPSELDIFIFQQGVEVLKIDCEGCEACIFRDCKSLGSLRLVLAESHDDTGQWLQRQAIQNRLSGMGFQIVAVRERSLEEGNFAILKATRSRLT